mmetsp:Transcript_81464/g.143870  ORF Transcript_81464/g.143870 Transcript_81464/m.143870 type:complete len:161 (+) Transcript_81464:107-589(+)|eukprot:CAMPEP_0197654566 /NCGR_PEP_ID=MMETSP1338-20131121/38926_1 /TAXON_ID=43686 ORGANISM="Pelagodinium beii, Strain RCC1491" /NCGR_SAMPLE_ID=MMETSP1338 /ASSEMBLY_ACC=CAM_ASM_000754 /LENGTH=160 /DNA_ID=CAMNT_0043230033 /DNA_START=71 /DNA_END=553 /DNA_ORIENTATION=-
MSDWEDDEWDEKAVVKAKPVQKEEDSSDEEPPPKPKAGADKEEPKKDDQKVIQKDSLAELDIKLQADVDWLTKRLASKLKDASAKGAPHKFLSDMTRSLQLKLDLKEAEQIHKICKDMHTKRKKAEQEAHKKLLEEEENKKKEALPQNEVSDADFFASLM